MTGEMGSAVVVAAAAAVAAAVAAHAVGDVRAAGAVAGPADDAWTAGDGALRAG